jgi:hypothetical protein
MTEKEIAGRLQSIAIAQDGDISYPVIVTVNGEILHTPRTRPAHSAKAKWRCATQGLKTPCIIAATSHAPFR